MNQGEPAVEVTADVAEQVRAVLERKWDLRPRSSDDAALSPWVRLDEVVATTGLSPFEARRVLDELAAAGQILYERPDRSRGRPAKWVCLVDRWHQLGLPDIPRPGENGPCVRHPAP